MSPPDSLGKALGLEPSALLAQLGWVRRLARELCADRELAEDLVQETCVAALERAPREAHKLRQWLAEVLRNALRQHARAQGRRLVREERSARAEAQEPADGLVERALLQRELVGAVLELGEPYRSTVLLRYFDELPPREIARRTGVPLATVQSRLGRALAQLRARLDGQHRAWAALFLPWTGGLESFGNPTLVSLLMNTKLVLAAAAAALAAGAFVWWNAIAEEPRARAAAPVAGADAPLEPGVPAGGANPAPRVSEREAVPVLQKNAPATLAGSPASVESAAPWTVRLRVLDAEALPMTGIAVRGEDDPAVLGTSGAGGWCTFTSSAARLVLSAADPRWVTVHAGSLARGSTIDPVLVLAPALDLAGVVLDEPGRPLAGASVRFELPDGFRTRFAETLESTRVAGWRTGSGEDGRFALERVPAVSGAHLTAVLAGYEMDALPVPQVSTPALELVLFRPKLPLAGVLRGMVLDRNGAAVSGARVGLGLSSVVSDERGEFQLDLAHAVTAEVLTALKVGFLPARLERPGTPGPGTTGWPERVTLILAAPALKISGVVLDQEEKPVPLAKVWVHDPTPAAPIGQMPVFQEPLMAGAPVPPQALESEANLPQHDGDNFMDWTTNARDPSALWHWVVSDGSGHFELPGLDARRYRLDVLRPHSLEVVTSESFAAGADAVVIRLGPPDFFAHVSGRVVSEAGAPVAGASVGLYRPMIDARARVFGGNSEVVIVEYAGRVTTDAEGRFRFDDVPRKGASLSIRGDAIVPTKIDVSADSFDVTVEVRCQLEVVLRDPIGRFDALELADADGKRLDVMVLTEGSVNAWTSAPIVQGRSGVVSVSSHARQLRLYKDKLLVETQALTLVPGEVNRIEP